MSDSLDHAELDDAHDDFVPTLPPISPEAILLAEEQAEEDFDFDFDDDFAEEFADEWEPVTASAEIVEEINADGVVQFVVEGGPDAD